MPLRFLIPLFALVVFPAAAGAQQRRSAPPDFKALLVRQFNTCATVTKDQELRQATIQVTLDRRGRVTGEPLVIGPGDDAAAKSFETAAREGLKSCGPYAFARSHPGSFERWRDMVVSVSSGELRRDPGWAAGRALAGGAAEPVDIVIKQGQDFAAMGAFTTIGGQCEVTAQGRVTIERQPRIGRLRSYIGPSPVSFKEGHRLSHCNKTIIDGTIVRYDRRGKQPGQDSFRFTVRFSDGEIRTVEANVTLQ
jgi:hypothetical protein